MNEIELFFDNALDKFDAGKILFENEKYGDAISRFYYAMFYAAKALLFEKYTKNNTYEILVYTEKFINECIRRSKTLDN